MLDAHSVCNHRPVDPFEIEGPSLGFEFASHVWPDRIADHDFARTPFLLSAASCHLTGRRIQRYMQRPFGLGFEAITCTCVRPQSPTLPVVWPTTLSGVYGVTGGLSA